MTRFRSILIALVAVALSAGAVLAGRPMPTASDSGLGTASDAAGRTVPAHADEGDEAEGPDQGDQDDNDSAEDADAPTHPDNHGADVSVAAHAGPQPGFANHGAYVSSIAKANDGQVTATEKKAGHGKPDDAGKPEGAGKPSN